MRYRVCGAVVALALCAGLGACSSAQPAAQPTAPVTSASTAAGTPAAETAPGTSPAASPTVATPTLVDGTYYGSLQQVDTATRVLQFDQEQFFTGAAAMQACQQDDVSPDAEWCNDYYVRDLKTTQRIPIAPDATIASQVPPDGGGISASGAPLTIDQLATVVANQEGAQFYRLTISGGQITDIFGIYTP